MVLSYFLRPSRKTTTQRRNEVSFRSSGILDPKRQFSSLSGFYIPIHTSYFYENVLSFRRGVRRYFDVPLVPRIPSNLARSRVNSDHTENSPMLIDDGTHSIFVVLPKFPFITWLRRVRGIVSLHSLGASSFLALNLVYDTTSTKPPQTLLLILPVRQIRVHEALENLSVVRREEVNQFMDDDELTQVFRQIQQFGVERQATHRGE